MTDYSTMPAGPEIDRLVAEKVMGWRWAGHYWSCGDGTAVLPEAGFAGAPPWSTAPRFSTDIAQAWKVVERMHELGFTDFAALPMGTPGSADAWTAAAMPKEATMVWWETVAPDKWRGDADTAPLAISRAALAIVEAMDR